MEKEIKKYNKESLKEALLKDEFDLDEVKFKLEGYDFELEYECNQDFHEGRNGGQVYYVTITRTKIGRDVDSIFSDTKKEAVEGVMNQLDSLLKINNNDKINKDIKYHEDKIIKLKNKLEN